MRTGNPHIVTSEAEKYNMDILGIAEHRWPGKEHFNPDGGVLIYSGSARGGYGGVAVFINQQYANTLLGYDPFNDQILVVRLKGKPVNVTIIQIYAPTSDTEENILEGFYDAFQSAVDSANK